MKKFFLWILVLYIGMVNGVLFFADYSAGETLATRTVTAIVLALFAGLLVGYTYTKRWWLSLLAAWLPILFVIMGLIYLFKNPGSSSEQFLSIVPVVGAGLGGYLGAYFKDRQQTRYFYGALILLALIFCAIVGFISLRK